MRFTLRRRRVAAATAVVAAALAAALVADAAAASRAESRLSQHALGITNGNVVPDAFVAGFPFALVALTKTVPRVELTALDVPVEGLGIVNTSTEAFDVEVGLRRAYNADFAGATAERVRHRVRLDGVACGQILGMTDLDISHPYDISPGGGPASEARLTGTVPGLDFSTTVIVTLRLEGATFQMRPSMLVDVPPDATDKVLAAYTRDIDTRELPLGGPADLVALTGGSIEFSREQGNVMLSDEDLAPISVTD